MADKNEFLENHIFMDGDHPHKPFSRNLEQARGGLNDLEFFVTQKKGTEMSYTGKYVKSFDPGTYHCIVCSQALFSSQAKYDAKDGYAAFYAPLSSNCLKEDIDTTHYVVRTEILCSFCDAHIGHVFEDGPADKGGLKFSANSAALDFKEIGEIKNTSTVGEVPAEISIALTKDTGPSPKGKSIKWNI